MLFGKANNTRPICFRDNDRGLVLYRYGSDPEDLPLTAGSTITVEPGQHIFIMKGNQLTDVWDQGTYRLIPEMFPRLAETGAFRSHPYGPLEAELYFITADPITERKWATRTPALVQEAGRVYRVRAYGTYDFRVHDVIGFILDVFIDRGLKTTYEVVNFLSTRTAGAFTATVSEMNLPVLEIINHPGEISSLVREKANRSLVGTGLEFINVLIEGSSLPD